MSNEDKNPLIDFLVSKGAFSAQFLGELKANPKDALRSIGIKEVDDELLEAIKDVDLDPVIRLANMVSNSPTDSASG